MINQWNSILDQVVRNLDETEEVADFFASQLKQGDAVCLTGPLGAGKTTLIRFLAKRLGYNGRVKSPSFTLVNLYNGTVPIAHVDLYRLFIDDELLALDLDEHRENGILLIEWGERFYESWGPASWKIELIPLENEARRIIISSAETGSG